MLYQQMWKTVVKTYVELFQQYLKDHPGSIISYGTFFFFCFETTLYTSCINKRYDYVLLQGPFTYSLVNQSIHQMYGEARDSLAYPRLFHILPIPLH